MSSRLRSEWMEMGYQVSPCLLSTVGNIEYHCEYEFPFAESAFPAVALTPVI